MPASFTGQTYPSLIAIYVKAEFLTTVLDGHTMLFVYMGNKLNQNLFSFLGDVFALEVTI